MDAKAAKSYDDAITKWARQMVREIEESLAKHAEFLRLYPVENDEALASDRPSV